MQHSIIFPNTVVIAACLSTFACTQATSTGGTSVDVSDSAVADASSDTAGTPVDTSGSDAAIDVQADALATDGAADVAEIADSVGKKCNPVKQDCPDPTLNCQIIKSGTSYTAACEAQEGDPIANPGDSCTRSSAGHDNCAVGSTCFPNGANGAFACRKFCAADSDCEAGEKCAAVTQKSPYFGVCYPTCTTFSVDCGKDTCANAFYDNDGKSGFVGCRISGTGKVGGACKSQFDCGANMVCGGGSGGFTCYAMCDATHACATGKCGPPPGPPNGTQICN